MSHEVHSFSFGDMEVKPHMLKYLLKYNQGSAQQKDAKFMWDYNKFFSAEEKKMTYEHYLRAVSTSIKWRTGEVLPFYEFAVSR